MTWRSFPMAAAALPALGANTVSIHRSTPMQTYAIRNGRADTI